MRFFHVSRSFVLSVMAALSCGGGHALALSVPADQATPPAAPAPQAPVATPAHADDANATLPEGMKVRDPGPKPDFKGGPAIYFHAIDHDFGTMTNAETRTYRFTFVNAGDAPLKIDAAVPKCSCTRPSFDKDKVYQPGESGFIEVAFTPPTGGHQAKAIVVKSNAAWPGELFNIRVIGKVESVLSFTPKLYDFGEVRRGTKWEADVKIVGDAKSTLFEGVASRNPEISCSPVGEGPHRGEATVRISVDPKIPWGSLRSGVITVNTRGKNEGGSDITKSLPLRITGVVVDEIRANEYIFQMQTVRPGARFSASVFLSHEEGKPIEVTDVTLAAMGPESKGIARVTYNPLQFAAETRDGKPGFVITLSGTTTADSNGFFGGSVRFKTKTVGDAAFVERELPIGGRVMTEAAEKALPTNRGGR